MTSSRNEGWIASFASRLMPFTIFTNGTNLSSHFLFFEVTKLA